jgi:hypothetical protein
MPVGAVFSLCEVWFAEAAGFRGAFTVASGRAVFLQICLTDLFLHTRTVRYFECPSIARGRRMIRSLCAM